MTDEKDVDESADVDQKIDDIQRNVNDALAAQANDVNEALQKQSADFEEKFNKKFSEILKAISESSTRAVDNPTSFTHPKGMDAATQDLGKSSIAEFKETETPELIEPVDLDPNSAEFKGKAEMLRFMEEPVRVRIHTTNEKHADPNFSISVNGKTEVFFRGHDKVVPRYIVEGLARAKPVHYESEERRADEGFENRYRYPARRGLRYPFEVIEDRNPRGRDWLKGVLQEP